MLSLLFYHFICIWQPSSELTARLSAVNAETDKADFNFMASFSFYFILISV
ncbi:hypothetical protein CL3_18420 [butyrate-producing bacterium SM4/1]|nr:hypothetical protein CLOM621_07179 [Clostridium sp. M62/1]CBK76377.1 hypothetical protein CLS_05800 [[Clostridium] cf. saccharolyticum K10]CBL36314.1 hypothetical protein CL3_18420 [butyrate-producing bacterium SM4/1]